MESRPKAHCFAAPPCPGRGLIQITVLRCPLCEAGHGHRVGDWDALLSGNVEKTCPTSGQKYSLSPVRVLHHPVRPQRNGEVPRAA